MGRHRHVVNVRADGIAVVLGPLLSDVRVTAAALVDVDSGMVLDAWSAAGPDADPTAAAPDLELLGAQHAEVVRCALALLRSWPSSSGHEPGPEADTCEVVLGTDGGPQHLLRTVPDPHGDRLALAVVVDGPPRVLDRVRRRLRSISVDALTAGPSMTRRPVLGGWSFAMPVPDVPPSTGADAGRLEVPVPREGQVRGSAPPVAAATALSAAPLDAPRGSDPVADPTVPRLQSLQSVQSSAAPGRALPGPGAVSPARVQRREAPTPRPPSPPSALPAPAPRESRRR